MSWALRFLGVGNAQAAVTLGSASAVLERDERPELMIDCGQEALTAFPGTVVLVSHDRYGVARMATRVVRVAGGHLSDVDLAADPEFASLAQGRG